MEERAVRGVPWTLLSYSLNKGLAVVTTIVLARLLTPTDFGLVALATIAINFLALMKDLGLGGTLIVDQRLSMRAQGTVLTLMVLTGVVVALVAVACSPLLAAAFDEPRLTGVVAGLGLMLVIGGYSAFYETLLQRELEFRARFAALVVQTVVASAVSIALAVLGAGVWSLVVGQVVALAAFAVAVRRLAPFGVPFAWDRGSLGRLFSKGRGFLVQGGSTFLRQNADYAVVAQAFGTAPLGFYSMAYRLGDLPNQAVADPVARVTFPAFARAQARAEPVGGLFLRVVRLVALVCCPLGILLSALAEPFTRVMFGEEWLPMVAPLAVLGLWAALRPVESTLTWLLNSVGLAGPAGVVSTLILVPLVPALVVVAALGDLRAVAWVVVADTALSFVLLTAVASRRADVPVGRQLRALAPVAIACVPAWAAARIVSGAVADDAAMLQLLAGLAAGGLVYLVGVSGLAPGVLPAAFRQLGRTVGFNARRAVR